MQADGAEDVVQRQLHDIAPVADRLRLDLREAQRPQPRGAENGHVELGRAQPDVDRQNAQLVDQARRLRLGGIGESNYNLVDLVALSNRDEVGDAGARLALAISAGFIEHADDAHARHLAQALGQAEARRAAGDDGNAPRRVAGSGEPAQQPRRSRSAQEQGDRDQSQPRQQPAARVVGRDLEQVGERDEHEERQADGYQEFAEAPTPAEIGTGSCRPRMRIM